MKHTASLFIAVLASLAFSAHAQETPPGPEEWVDTMIGVTGNGSCIPGVTLPHGSIYASPDSEKAVASGYREGSPVVGFSQLHAQGAGSSTLSYGNFLISPRLGAATDERDNGSPITGMETHPYSFRGTLTRWGIDCAIAPAHNAAFYEFEFPVSDDARINVDIARKLGSSTAMRDGSVHIDLKKGAIYGGGTFDGNWNPAAYTLYFYAMVDTQPIAGGTWIGDTVSDGTLSAEISDRRKLGGWMQFDTTATQTVHLKIAVSFDSVEKAKFYLEHEIAGWNFAAVESAAKNRWHEALSVVETPGIRDAEARKLYTALFHTLIQPRDRTGDPAGWPKNAQFWDDQYTLWDTWQTLYPLLSIIQPDAVAGIVNSFAERYAHHGVAETAFIMGKDYQVGQGGDEVDRIIADALVREIDGIDWKRVWALLRFNAERRTPDYKMLGYVPTNGDKNGYDFRMQSGSSTLGFAHCDWCAAQVAEKLGKTREAAKLMERSRNWRNVWNAQAEGDGFSGFLQGRDKDGNFLPDAVTSHAGFYQGTAWNYSFNIPHERDAMIERMGGHARFIQRLNFAFAQNNSRYIDFSNEVNMQACFLFGMASRPHLSSSWVDVLRKAYGASYPGDEDSGAMASLYFFTTAGIFPMATEDIYYLHGARIPEIILNPKSKNAFTIKAQNAGDKNIYTQSASLNGIALDRAVIHHADITKGGSLNFVMGPYPNIWGTGGDFRAPNKTASQLINSSSNAFDEVKLDAPGDSITLSAKISLNGSNAPDHFEWGLFDANQSGYLASDSRMLRITTEAKQSLESYTLPAPDFAPGTYDIILTLTLNEQGAIDYYAALSRSQDGVLIAAYTGSDLQPAALEFNRIVLSKDDEIRADTIGLSDCRIYKAENRGSF
ncbi:MAG: GH92 family glycosyl hydrolase [Pontiellaceae bacterium]|nr:GH92 family glycosyl hydrolase [Pontiellaceae bacterium]MBN2785049.1 GH92 family glycosyl hydrolase [Pontiellaceae bacterium]